ncbi:hypothetical protein N8I71_20555 [Roseibacterium sp. SDUM158016]|uniref:hypothetical protein n=1 Tax=Roseicyclus sediminis TaxID=2980997 RepID=UPI0021D19A8F|nr:hypothetical protein [Roseibacterium sp. SDUM158016]MCU4655241.1 hypothetical protein [Roseibacterium sp. SDUM158016]
MDKRDWTGMTPAPGDRIEAEGLCITCLAPEGATLVSGDLDAAIAHLAPGRPMLGLLGPLPEQGGFALRIARDRALLCTASPLGVEGWREGFAASAADDLYLALSVAGPRAGVLRSACLSAEAGSPSAAALCVGTVALVAGEADGAGWRLWVPGPEAAAVWHRLGRLAVSL